MGLPESILANRLELLSRLKSAFVEIHPEPLAKYPRGKIQKELLSIVGISPHSFNRRIVTEAMSELGYRKVKIEGVFYYRR